MNRREFVITALALISVGTIPAIAQADVRSKLRLKRKGNWDKTCVNCIPGELFGLDNGVQEKLCDTFELSFEENHVNKSAIPPGVYPAFLRTDRSKTWMNSKVRAWRLELENVDNRRAIQFHYGKDVSWSKGCIIVGQNIDNVCAADQCAFSDSPTSGMQRLIDYVEPKLLASNHRVQIEIV